MTGTQQRPEWRNGYPKPLLGTVVVVDDTQQCYWTILPAGTDVRTVPALFRQAQIRTHVSRCCYVILEDGQEAFRGYFEVEPIVPETIVKGGS